MRPTPSPQDRRAPSKKSACSWGTIIGIAALSFVFGDAGLVLSIPPGIATAVWPPSGIAVAAVLLFGQEAWPGIWLGSFLVNAPILLARRPALEALGMATAIAVGSTVQDVLAARVIRERVGLDQVFGRVRGAALAICAIMTACLIAPSIGAAAMAAGGLVTGPEAPRQWLTWWIGDAMGILLLLPFAAAAGLRRPPRWEARALEIALLAAGTAAASIAIFRMPRPLEAAYLLIPFALWAALRTDATGVASAAIIIAGAALTLTVRRLGENIRTQAVLPVQSFLGVLTVAGFILAATVQEFKRANARLAESERRFRGLVEQSKDFAMYILDPQGRVASWNEGAERITGYTTAEIIGKRFATFFPTADAARGDPARELKRAVEMGSCLADGWRLRKDGERFWGDVVITTLRDARGGLLGFGVFARDTTERKRLNLDLVHQVEDRTKALESGLADLEEFAYTMARDLRAPLRSLECFSHILRSRLSGKLPSDAEDLFARIDAAAIRMDRLTRDALVFSRIGRAELAVEPLDLDSAVEKAAADRPALGAGLAVKKPLGKVMAQESLLAQAVARLLDNAAKSASPERPLRIEVMSEESGANVRVSFRDNGVGLSPEARERIFRPFARSPGKRRLAESGIGLAIVKKAVERMNGRLGVESEAGRGNRFWFELPRAP